MTPFLLYLYPKPENTRKKSLWTTTVDRTWQTVTAQLPPRCCPYILYLSLKNSNANVASFSSRNTFKFSNLFHKWQCCPANYFLNNIAWTTLAYTTGWKTILKSTRILRKIFPSRNWTHKSMEILQKVLLKLRGMSVLTFNLF